MTAMTSAGTTIAVSATLPATEDQSGYEALTFTNAGEIVNVGEYGKTYNLVTHNPIDNRRTVKKKGSYNQGALNLQLARDPADAGQAILLAALDSDNDYAFEVTLQDGTIQYFSAQVLSYTTNIGNVDQITGASVQVEITTDIIEV